VEPAQVDEEHVVERPPPGEPVPDVDGEPRLADAGHAAQCRDDHRLATVGHPEDPVQLGRAAGETGQILRQRVQHPDLGGRPHLAADHA
jgi:hypothetical protein